MGITAISGPHISYGIVQTSSGLTNEYNEQRSPDVSDLGYSMMDPRPYFSYQPGGAVTETVNGFFNAGAYIDYVPSAVSSNNLATNQAPVANTALTLTAGSGVTSTTIVAPETGLTTGTLLCIDSTAATLAYGTAGTVQMWNPAAGTGRCVSITTSSSGDGGSWSIYGRDMYGIPMTENLSVTGSSATVTSRKAFKYISAIKASTTITSTGIIVGVSDTFGLPLLAKNTGLNLTVRIITTSSLVSANSSGPITTGSTATQTATSSDPRGTYASTTATNGTNRLQMWMPVTPAMTYGVTATDTSLLFGATQFSSV